MTHATSLIPQPYAWRELVQQQITSLLSASPLHADLALAEWQSVKARWQAFVREIGADLLERDRSVVSAQLLSEQVFDGFRVQKLVFESFPGWQVGLNLFLPLQDGQHVPILCPCGHGPKWLADHQIPPQALARNGFAAALFDMPMFGEKWRRNSHFHQGSQAAMVGKWSHYFFLIDAMRAADYLETRPDITFTHGMGVTGVSGGGIATLYLAQLDDRVQAIVPVCCVSPFSGYLVEGLYTGCPETYMFGQAKLGMDFNEPVCLASPLPCLVISGTQDTLFTPPMVEQSVKKAHGIYTLEGVGERLALFTDDAPHSYTARMAGEAVRWFNRWLLGIADAPVCDSVTLLPETALDCGTTDTTIAMLDVMQQEAAGLKKTRRPDLANDAITEVLRLPAPVPVISEEIPSAGWGHPGLRKRLLHAEGSPALPVVEMPCTGTAEGTLVCFTDQGIFSSLAQNSGLFGACVCIIAADLRGFGLLAPAPTDYDMYGWCSVDRALGDLIHVCGETIMGGQVVDALRILESVTAQSPSAALMVYGRGEAALPALFAGLLRPDVTHIVLHEFMSGFEALATTELPTWSRYQYLPGILQRFDLPELFRERTDKQYLLINPLDGVKEPLEEGVASAMYGYAQPHVTLRVIPGPTDPARIMREWLDQRD